MTSPRKRPSVKNKKAVRPAGRAGSVAPNPVAGVSGGGGQQTAGPLDATGAVAAQDGLGAMAGAEFAPWGASGAMQGKDAATAPSVAGAANFSAHAQGDSAGPVQAEGGQLFPEVPAMAAPPKAPIPFADSPEEEGPADFFDLGDGSTPAFTVSRGGASSRSRGAGNRASARPVRLAGGAPEDTAAGSDARRARSFAGGHGDDAKANAAEAARGSSARARRGAGRAQAASRRKAPNARDAARPQEKPRSGSVRKIILLVVGILVAVALALGAFFLWDKYLRYDDAADIQGEWRTQDGSMTVVIDSTDIRMPDLEYAYEIDTSAKTLTFTFSDLSGSGSYEFSGDRTQLTIVEGQGDSAATTVLVKVSDNTQATPQLLNGESSAGGDAGEASAGDESTGSESGASSEGEGAPEGEASGSTGGGSSDGASEDDAAADGAVSDGSGGA